jgi:hypothetical protein
LGAGLLSSTTRGKAFARSETQHGPFPGGSIGPCGSSPNVQSLRGGRGEREQVRQRQSGGVHGTSEPDLDRAPCTHPSRTVSASMSSMSARISASSGRSAPGPSGSSEGAVGGRGWTVGKARSAAAVASKGTTVLRLKGRKRFDTPASSAIRAVARTRSAASGSRAGSAPPAAGKIVPAEIRIRERIWF